MIDTSLDQTRASRSELLGRTSELANEFLNGVGDRPVARTVDFDKLLAEMGVNGLPLDGNEPKQIVEHRSEEHTSELQSHLNLVCRLLLEKKKKKNKLSQS